MRKRMTSLLLTLVMLLSLVPAMGVTASAADDTYGYGNIKDWSGFKSYLSSPTSRDLTLENDIDYTTGYDDDAILITKSQKLDLNGHKIRIDASKRAEFYNLITIRSGEFTLYDSKGGGAIEVEFARDSKGHCIIMISPDSAGAPAKFTMNGGTLTRLNPMNSGAYGNNGCISDNYFVPFKGGERPQITINGGTINCAYDWDRSNASMRQVEYMPTALLLRYSKLTVKGGTFNGIVWTDELLWREGDAEPRVLLNGGVFNFPFAVTSLLKNKTQMVIDGARFNDGLYVAKGIKLLSYEGNEPAMLIKSGVFDASGQNLKLDIRSVTADGWYTAQGKQQAIKYAMKLFPNSAIKLNGKIYTSENIGSRVIKDGTEGYYLNLNLKGPIEVIRNAWGMKSVTLDGNPINYAKDWQGGFEEMDNSTAHTLTFEWYPLAQELKDAGYSYRTKCEHYFSGSTAVQQTDTIAANATSHTITIEKGADPKVYSFDLHLNLEKNGSTVGIIGNEHIVKLVVSEAPPAPPAPVAHSIKIVNTFGTATPSTAMAGETITVKAKDRTAENMMFTQWYAKTAGVTFKDATKQETTFVMPDCDVEVNPGFQQVSFTKQPVPQISLEKGYGGKTSFVFSWDISKWELVDTATNQTVSSDNTPVKAGKLTDVTIPANTDLGSKTYRIVVTTANGEQFKSNDFIVTWFETMPAPLVEFSIPSDTKFIGEMTVNVGCPSTLETGGVSPFETCYTTNGVDPKDADPSDIQCYSGYTDVTLNKTTHFMARTILEGEGGNEDTWGELCEATYTMIDKLDAPTVTPTSCSYSGSLPIIVTIQDVYNAEIDYSVKQHDGYLSGGDEPGPMLETGLPDTFCGTTTFSAKAIVYKDGGGAWESDEVTYTYTREYWANISNATISGKVNKAIADTDVTITLDGEKFKDVAVGDDVSGWFNLPAGLTAKVKEQTSYSRELVITISGTPTATSAATITVTIPKDKLLANGTVDLTVLSNPKAVYNIGTDAVHTHDYTGQPYLYLDPGNHYQECTANDGGYNIQPHAFTPWTDNGNGTHSRHCTVCKMTDSSTYTETANHNWQWVVDTAATPNAAGKQHEECVDCHVKRSENTEIPMLTSIMVEHLTVAKPVKAAAAAAATTTDSTYTVANTEWMAADGTPLAIGGTFQPGTVYTVKITLETTGAGVFSVKSTYNTIEGKTATVSPALTGNNHADSVELTYTFDATEGTYVPTKPAITTVALPDGKVGEAYSQTLAATGTTPITWSIEAGTLPDGLTLVGDTIKGTPSKAGDFKFTVKATNGGGSDTKELTIKVADAEAAKYHNVTLSGAGTGATGAGSHAAGTTVNIYAGTKSGYTFNGWTSDDVTVLSASSKNASFVMPDKDVTVKANWVYNGGGSSGGGYTYYTIKATAGVNGSISPTGNVSVREGRDQTFTITPNKGYAVAKVLIDSKNVGAVKSYTFENVKKNHTIEVVFMKASGNPQTGVFVDVPEGSYYEEAVNWAVEKGITTGTDATHFSPDGICTRAQAVTFLWRAAGSPAAKSAVMPFTDVKAGSYYYDAVLWAVENGITKGTSDTMFSPDATCSRAQIVTFLWRSQKSPAAGTANPFTDVKASAYYADAVLWAVKEDVTKGTTNTTFSPDANCTRAQIVTFIWRALAE